LELVLVPSIPSPSLEPAPVSLPEAEAVSLADADAVIELLSLMVAVWDAETLAEPESVPAPSSPSSSSLMVHALSISTIHRGVHSCFIERRSQLGGRRFRADFERNLGVSRRDLGSEVDAMGPRLSELLQHLHESLARARLLAKLSGPEHVPDAARTAAILLRRLAELLLDVQRWEDAELVRSCARALERTG
jgi:hypothetical protein